MYDSQKSRTNSESLYPNIFIFLPDLVFQAAIHMYSWQLIWEMTTAGAF